MNIRPIGWNDVIRGPVLVIWSGPRIVTTALVRPALVSGEGDRG